VAQKQSGSTGSSFVSQITYPENYAAKWNFPESAEKNSDGIKSKTALTADRFKGIVFEKMQ
jgi:hypothetical protein